mmetsp:Transcript_11513/g.26670  ORF Transcript_11513/g.26670 Transcript_11513/m.26670 type:complete len:100 (-) Transcript_11513:63-362(-)
MVPPLEEIWCRYQALSILILFKLLGPVRICSGNLTESYEISRKYSRPSRYWRPINGGYNCQQQPGKFDTGHVSHYETNRDAKTMRDAFEDIQVASSVCN